MQNIYNYNLIRSRRRTISIEIQNGAVLVRAPYYATKTQIDAFVTERRDWILKHQKIEAERREQIRDIVPLSKEEMKALQKKAREVFPERVRYYAALAGVDYGRITVRFQKTRWGSCSAKGNLNFNCLLLLTPPEVLDSVVAHEVCHRKQMNHSKKFHEELSRIFPEHRKCQKWLKENGEQLLARIP